MALTKLEPATLIPGITGDNANIGTVLANADAAYEYGPAILDDGGFQASTASASDVVVANVRVPGNADKVPVTLMVRVKTTAGTATVTLALGAATTTGTTTSTSFVWLTITVTPAVAGPINGKIKLKTSAGTASIEGVSVFFAPGAPANGLLPSGFAKTAWWDQDATAGPFPSYLAKQLWNNPRAVARDRPAGLYGGIQDVSHGTVRWSNNTTTPALVEKWMQPLSDIGSRPYRIVANLAGTNPKLQVNLGGFLWTVTGTGWQETTKDLAIPAGVIGTAHLWLSSGVGTCYLDTLQVFREPN